ncbi:diaminopropionate ammonia-lyase [Lysinibacillus sp. LZ02]|uniref:diaminopropionate ammonia-lyase n=1 Tax=Lysinibacillus sp. LZ02 TaxID=3420668 RepID=UPI003D36A846
MQCKEYIQWTKNHHQKQERGPIYSHFTQSVIEEVLKFQQSHVAYTKTPLHSLKQLAKKLNVETIHVKDESQRFGLNAFKVLGGVYAIAKYIADTLAIPFENLTFDDLKSEEVKKKLGQLTFITATDGNHGRGVAWAARELGHQSIVFMPKGSAQQRLEAIRSEGAEAHILELNYDDCVRECARLAQTNGYIVIQDTAWDGYEHIPLWIMQGYATIGLEIAEELPTPPTHIFLQAGVGSFAGAITAFFHQLYSDNPPKIIIVEADQADCYYQSFLTKDASIQFVTGDMATIMAGLACGEPNKEAYRILSDSAFATFSCDDTISALGMRIYGNPCNGDPTIISGESGAVTLGLLYYLQKFQQEIGKELGLDGQSRILLISTEGDTDLEQYEKVTWLGHFSLK